MKRISKILSVLMVVAILFSIAAVPVSAATDPNFTIKYQFRDKAGNTAINSAKAGDIIRLYTMFNWNKKVSVVSGAYAWNTTALTMYNKVGTAALVDAAPHTASFNHVGEWALTSAQTITDPDMSLEDNTYYFSGTYMPYGAYIQAQNRKLVPTTWDTDMQANWLAFAYSYAIDPTKQMLLVDTKGDDMDLMYSYFYVNRDIDDLSTVIMTDDASLDDKIYLAYPVEQSYFFAAMADTNTNVVVNYPTSVYAAPEYDVYKLADSRKHLADDSKYTTATFFAFKNIAPDFNDKGTSQFITGITATVTASSGGTSITVTPDAIRFVYDLGSGEYGFRVICKGLPADADVTITPVVTTTDSATYAVETQSFNVADLTAY